MMSEDETNVIALKMVMLFINGIYHNSAHMFQDDIWDIRSKVFNLIDILETRIANREEG